MPLFQFHIADGETATDTTNLQSVAEAKRHAVMSLSRILSAQPDELWAGGAFNIVVQDQEGLTLFRLDVVSTDAERKA